MSAWLLALALSFPVAVAERPAMDLRLAQSSSTPRPADWRVYGPIRVDWSSWRLMDGSWVTRSQNERSQPFYLSVNCQAGQINVTGAGSTWKGWEKPQAGFETRLIAEACAGSSP